MNRPKRGKLYRLFKRFNRPVVWFVALLGLFTGILHILLLKTIHGLEIMAISCFVTSAVIKIVEWGTKYIREKRKYNGETKE